MSCTSAWGRVGATAGRGEAVGVIDGRAVAEGVWDGLVVGVTVAGAVGVEACVTAAATPVDWQAPSRSAPRRAAGKGQLAKGFRIATATPSAVSASAAQRPRDSLSTPSPFGKLRAGLRQAQGRLCEGEPPGHPRLVSR